MAEEINDPLRKTSETAPLLTGQPPQTAYLEAAAQYDAGDSEDQGVQAETGGHDEEEEEQQRNPSQYEGLPEVKKRMKYILPALSIGIFLSACDQTIIVSSYGLIGSEMRALELTSWISTAYLMTMTAAQPLYGKLSDVFGRKQVLLCAYALFGAGCALCGLAARIEQLVLARALAGIGAGGMNTVVSIVISDIVPLRERGTWQAMVNLVFASGASLGAPLGGIVADRLGWRWSFLAQVPLVLTALVAVWFVLRLPGKEADSVAVREKLRRVDFLGSGVLTGAIFALILGLDRGANVGWTSWLAIIPLAEALPLFITFVHVERKYAVEPIAPPRIIFERSLLASYLCNFFSLAGWFGVIFYTPLFFQVVRELDALQAGLRLLPAIVAGVVGSLVGGLVMQKTGKYYWLSVSSYTLIPIGTLLIFLFSGLVGFSIWGVSIGLLLGVKRLTTYEELSGLGNGAGITVSLVALISSATPADQAVVTACSFLFRSLGTVVGVAAQSAMLQSALQVRLRQRLAGKGDVDKIDAIARMVRKDFESIKDLEPAVQALVRASYGDAVRVALAGALGFATVAIISSGFVREKSLNKR